MAKLLFSSWLVFALIYRTAISTTTTTTTPPRSFQVIVDTLFTPQSCLLTSQTNDRLAVTYVGTLTRNGKQFDASEDRKNPFLFTLGVGQVIQGWDQGMMGMCEGEKRLLKIPSELAYGHGGAGDDIPPDAPLTFHVELIKIENRKYDSKPFKELKIETTLKPKTCPIKSKKGDRLAMIYVGTLKSDGLQFDAITTPNQPFEFKLGAGEVIKGWEKGLEGMCVGEKRRLFIPASMAYGPQGENSSNPPIPPNADLVFDTQLIEIRNKSLVNVDDQNNQDLAGRWLWRLSIFHCLSYFSHWFLVFL